MKTWFQEIGHKIINYIETGRKIDEKNYVILIARDFSRAIVYVDCMSL